MANIGDGFDFSGLGDEIGSVSALFKDLFNAIKKHTKDAAKDFKDLSKDLFDSIDGVLGGVPGKVKDFITNPIGGALTLIAGTMADFVAQTDDLGKKFGAIGVTEFRVDILAARTETLALGRGFDAITDTMSELADNFGISAEKAAEMSTDITEASVALGLSNTEGSKLIGILSTGTGLSAKSAINLSKQTALLAKQEGLVPNTVMKDMADSSESVAKFVKQGGKNIAVAAIQARKLGTNLSTVAKIAEGLLDFQSSIESEMEASVMIGRQLNYQRARELVLTGNLSEAMGEIVSQLGSEAEFYKLNSLQRDSLAKSIGVGTDELAKFVKLQGKSVSEQMELTSMPFDELIADDAIASVTLLTNKLKAMGARLTELLAKFTGMIGITKDSSIGWDIARIAGIGLGIAIIGIGLAAVASSLKIWAMSKILKKSGKGIGEFGLTASYAIPILLVISGVALSIAAVFLSFGKAIEFAGRGIKSVTEGFAVLVPKVQDLIVALQEKLTLGGIGRIVLLSASLTGLSISLAAVAASGIFALPILTALNKFGLIGVGKTDTTETGMTISEVYDKKVSDKIDMLQNEINGLRDDMKSYFGIGGTVAVSMGRETIKGIERAQFAT